jgi:hypothetical protein
MRASSHAAGYQGKAGRYAGTGRSWLPSGTGDRGTSRRAAGAGERTGPFEPFGPRPSWRYDKLAQVVDGFYKFHGAGRYGLGQIVSFFVL